jgi:hypothetical protein
LIKIAFAIGTRLADGHSGGVFDREVDVQAEIIALLFPEKGPTAGGAAQFVMALMRDAEGLMELRRLAPEASLLGKARVAGRMNRGKPIVDPVTREVIGCEIEPLTDPAC